VQVEVEQRDAPSAAQNAARHFRYSWQFIYEHQPLLVADLRLR
jgi:hypothetical protein